MTDVIDRSRKQRLEQIKVELDLVDRKAARVMYEWGQLFTEVERDELWREDGATSFTAWVEDETPYSQQTARRAIDVLRHFTLPMVDRWGSTKLAAVLRYAELTGKDEQPGDLTALDIRFRDKSGQYTSVSFANAKPKQIQEACKQLVEAKVAKQRKQEEKQLDPSVRARAQRLQKELPPPPSGTVRGSGDRVVVQKGKDGQMALTFKAIPVSELAAFVEMLKKHLLDDE